VDDLFNFKEIRVKQPTKVLAGRARFEIYAEGKNLLAVATEAEGRSVLDKISRTRPDSRVLMITDPAGEPIAMLAFHGAKWLAELIDTDDNVIGRIRVGGSRRHYSLLDREGAEIGQAVGDLAVRRFTVTGTNRPPFADVRKTFAGPIKEAFTSSDHYTVRFVLSSTPLERTLTAIFPIVLDLARYGPA
jgi:hypothetical protein